MTNILDTGFVSQALKKNWRNEIEHDELFYFSNLLSHQANVKTIPFFFNYYWKIIVTGRERLIRTRLIRSST